MATGCSGVPRPGGDSGTSCFGCLCPGSPDLPVRRQPRATQWTVLWDALIAATPMMTCTELRGHEREATSPPCINRRIEPGTVRHGADSLRKRGLAPSGSPLACPMASRGSTAERGQAGPVAVLRPSAGTERVHRVRRRTLPHASRVPWRLHVRRFASAVLALLPTHRADRQVGGLVITEPMPSMPRSSGTTPNGRYRAAYFDINPAISAGTGLRIEITERGTRSSYGRSDSTINRQGVRMGTSEIYRGPCGRAGGGRLAGGGRPRGRARGV